MTREYKKQEVNRFHDALHSFIELKAAQGIEEDLSIGRVLGGLAGVLTNNEDELLQSCGFALAAVAEHIHPDSLSRPERLDNYSRDVA